VNNFCECGNVPKTRAMARKDSTTAKLMTKTQRIALFCILASSAGWAAKEAKFAVKESHKDSNGVTFTTTAGTMRIEVCGNRVIHVVASPTSQIPRPKVPVVTQTCKADKLQVQSTSNEVKLFTEAVVVKVCLPTGAVSFWSRDGKQVLAEPKDGGKSFDVPSAFEAETWQLQQAFLSPSDEALYGLGQHQEGIFNVRGVPIRLHQANTNISIPFLLSSKGYGILWNNASLTQLRERANSPPAQRAFTASSLAATIGTTSWSRSTGSGSSI
jgi:alpha-D-xyloside xylohydrolase